MLPVILSQLNMYTQINELFHPTLSFHIIYDICSQHLALANQEIPQLNLPFVPHHLSYHPSSRRTRQVLANIHHISLLRIHRHRTYHRGTQV